MAKNKMKTKRAAAKRFKVTGSGKIKRFKAYKGHLTAKKSPARKRRLRKSTLVSPSEEKNVKRLLHN
jgi:large subunit ribosomal protein L35